MKETCQKDSSFVRGRAVRRSTGAGAPAYFAGAGAGVGKLRQQNCEKLFHISMNIW